MISMIKKNTAKNALIYVMQKKDAELLHANCLFQNDPNGIAQEMRAITDLHNLKNPVWHISLSLENGEKASDEQWKIAGATVLKSLGFDLDQTHYIL